MYANRLIGSTEALQTAVVNCKTTERAFCFIIFGKKLPARTPSNTLVTLPDYFARVVRRGKSIAQGNALGFCRYEISARGLDSRAKCFIVK